MKLFGKKDLKIEVRYSDTFMEPAYLPTRASSYKPDWYKNLPSDLGVGDPPNAKKCPAVVYGLSSGFLVYLPYDVVTEMEGTEFRMYAADSRFEVDFHHVKQVGSAFNEDNTILKLYMPFSIVCNEDTQFAYSYPAMHNLPYTNTISGPYGEIDFKYNSSLHVFLFLKNPPAGTKKSIVLKRGTPIAQIVPLTERKVDIEYKNTLEWRPRARSSLHGVTSYFDIKSHARRINQ